MRTINIKLIIAIITITILAGCPKVPADDPCSLQVSGNSRFLVHENGEPFFPIADTAWGIAWKLNRKEVDRYLQRRKEQSFNTIALIAFPSYEGAAILPNAYGNYVFETTGNRWNPLQPITTPGENPENAVEYDYWDHLEYIIDASGDKGMYVVLLPAWGGCVAGDWGNGTVTSEIIFDSNSAYEYGHWIGHRFANKKNIIWMMGGDRSAIYDDRDYRSVFRSMAEGVAAGVNEMASQDTQTDYSTTLMSYHPRKWMPNSSEWFHNDPWMDFNSIQDQPKDQIVATGVDYKLSPPKPTWLFEGGYEFRGRGKEQYKDWQIRFQSYQTVFAGGFGVTYGSMNVFHFNSDISDMDEPITVDEVSRWEVSLDEEGALDMQHLFNLMTSMTRDQFLDRIPDQDLIDGDTGTMTGTEGAISTCIQATRGAKGNYAMIYSANGRNIRVKMDRLSSRKMNAFWFNPRNGTYQVGNDDCTEQQPFAENIPGGDGAAIQEFDPPGNAADGNDWVLILKDAAFCTGIKDHFPALQCAKSALKM